jgi:hypothetical protein
MHIPGSDYRMADTVVSAARLGKAYYKPHAVGAAALRGLRYERRVLRELQRHVHLGHFLKVEHNPWFTFTDRYGTNQCSPDYLLWLSAREAIIIEAKLTWVEVAAQKLVDLYLPVVFAALDDVSVMPLVICRNVVPSCPPVEHTLRAALDSEARILHWPDVGHMLW